MIRRFSLAISCCLCLLLLCFISGTAQAAETDPIAIPFRQNPIFANLDLPLSVSVEAPTLYASTQTRDQSPAYMTEAEAVAYLREQMVNRTESLTLYVKSESYDYEALADSLLDRALVHTGKPKEGDYLLFNFVGWGGQVAQEYVDGMNGYQFELYLQYYTTQAQERTMDNYVASTLNSLKISNKTPYEKTKAIYQYICNNIPYDESFAGEESANLPYTAYGALVNKKATSEGYVSLLYRLLLEMGIDNHIIFGETSLGMHCWNIVKLDNVWYNTDITYDAIQTEYSFFLRDSENFLDHIRYLEYDTVQYHTDYPTAEEDYTPGVAGKPEHIYVWGYCGENAYWTIDRDKKLTILGTGATDNYHTDEAYGEISPWIPWLDGFNQVVVEEGITYLGECSFYNMSNVKQVTLAGSLETIGGSAFQSCINLSKLDLGKGVKVIGGSAFANCTSLPSIPLPDSVTLLMEGAFSNCSAATQIRWSASLESIPEHAFAQCAGLKTLSFPANITRIDENAFLDCDGLTKLTIPSHITYLSGFAGCDSLESVTFQNSHIGPYAFVGCTKLNNLVIPDSVTKIEAYAFQECRSLDKITWGTGLTEIGEGAFAGCLGTAKLVLPEGLQRIGDHAFSNWKLLTEVTVPGTVTYLSGFSYCENLTTVNTQNNYTHIGGNAFSNCTSLKPFPIPDSVVEIGGEAFRGLPQLKEILIPESVTTLAGHAFYDCRNLEKAVLNHNGIIDSYTFGNCFSLKEVQLNGDITEIGFCAFDGCQITSITFPKTLTKIHAVAFSGCRNLAEIHFTGDAPAMEFVSFQDVTATAYYPASNPTWTADKLQDYGGSLTWVDGHVHELKDSKPVYDPATRTHRFDCMTCDAGPTESCSFTAAVTRQPTMDQKGIRLHTCSVCGGNYEETLLYRLYGANRYETSFSAADALKQQLGVEKFDTIIVASGAGFADALTGSYLACVKNAPILLVNKHFIDRVAEYVDANLSEGGTVYLLGGELAVPETMKTALKDHNVVRLAGQNRYETNLAILAEAGASDQEVLICHGTGFADSLSASATGKPILMVNRSLNAAQIEYLEGSSGNFVIIGGTNAISEAIQAQLDEIGNVKRIGGDNRYQTSVLVAEAFFTDPSHAVLAYGANFPDGLCGGPLAYSIQAPLILTRNQNAATAAAYTAKYGITSGAVLGGPALISDEAVLKILP